MPDSVEFNSSSNSQSVVTGVLLPAGMILIVILGGLFAGWFLSSKKVASTQVVSSGGISTAPGSEVTSGGKEIGSKDTSTFRDRAEGVLEEGGIEGEGTHHLVRDGGPSKYAYLTSSVIDLDELVGQKIEVWGETLDSKKAGWLMDVGRVKILE